MANTTIWQKLISISFKRRKQNIQAALKWVCISIFDNLVEPNSQILAERMQTYGSSFKEAFCFSQLFLQPED